jgi:Pvc16 N-terminal domain
VIETAHRALAQLTASAVAADGPAVAVSVGPPELAEATLGLNWFLYAVRPVEFSRLRPGPGRDGGLTPLALELRYLLSAHHGQGAPPDHAVRLARALEAVLQAVHEHPIVTPVDAAGTMLRVEHDLLDTETLGRLWLATTVAARTAMAFRVTGVTPPPG